MSGINNSNNNNSLFKSCAGDIANPVTHTALDFFEKPSVLVNYESAFDQEVFAQVGASGPTLEFVVSGDNRNCIDLNYIHLSLVAAIYDEESVETKSKQAMQLELSLLTTQCTASFHKLNFT